MLAGMHPAFVLLNTSSVVASIYIKEMCLLWKQIIFLSLKEHTGLQDGQVRVVIFDVHILHELV